MSCESLYTFNFCTLYFLANRSPERSVAYLSFLLDALNLNQMSELNGTSSDMVSTILALFLSYMEDSSTNSIYPPHQPHDLRLWAWWFPHEVCHHLPFNYSSNEIFYVNFDCSMPYSTNRQTIFSHFKIFFSGQLVKMAIL